MFRTSLTILFILISVIFVDIAYAQSVTWGPENNYKEFAPKIIGSSNDLVFSVGTNEENSLTSIVVHVNKIHFKTLSKKDGMKSIFDKVFELEKEQGIVKSISGYRILNNNYHFFYSKYNKSEKTYELFVAIFDGATGQEKGAHKRLIKEEVEGRWVRGAFDVLVSKDQSKVFIYHSSYSKSEKANVRKYTLFDQDLEQLMQKSVPEGEFMPDSYLIDNDGSIFYAGMSEDEVPYVGSYDALRDYEKWKEDIKFEGQESSVRIKRLHLALSPENELQIFGYFSKEQLVREGKKRKNYTLAGICFARYERESKEQRIGKLSYFNSDFTEQFRTDKQREKGINAWIGTNYDFNMDIHYTKDGKIIVVGERYIYQKWQDDDGRKQEAWTYKSIIATCINKEGNIDWAHRIYKSQSYRTSSSSTPARVMKHFSFISGLSNTQFVVVHVSNLRKIKTATVHKCTIDLSTGVKKKTSFPEARNEFLLSPLVNYQGQQGDPIIIYGINKQMVKLGLMELE